MAQRQHFLPQFLLKGFASRVTKDATRVYVFRRGSRPFETNVTNVAVAGDFYESVKAPAGLEERLSIQESTYAVLVDDLRKGIFDPDRSDLTEGTTA